MIRNVSGDRAYSETFLEMYREYIADLKAVEPKVDDAITITGIYSIFYDRKIKIFFCFAEGKIVGFIMVREDDPRADLYIAETYIDRRYRRRRIGTRCIEELLSLYDGIVHLDILKKNYDAIRFWGRIMREREDISLGNAVEDELCIEKFFKIKKAVDE